MPLGAHGGAEEWVLSATAEQIPLTLWSSPQRKPSVPLGKGLGSTRPPPASRLWPQLLWFDEQ